ncbi:MAG: dephospho-CoA kinase [candidate division FCPU426 bacterium]
MKKRTSASAAPVLIVTGGSGSGKSTVAAVFGRLGARVLDVDRLARRLLATGAPAWHEILDAFCEARWGKRRAVRPPLSPADFTDRRGRALDRLPWAVSANGAIRRDRLGAAVFADRRALRTLNRITHPRLRRLLEQEIRNHRSRRTQPLVLDMAVYTEKIFRGLGRRVMWVQAPSAARVQRLVRKLGLSPAAALARIRRQRPNADYRRVADMTLANRGSLADLRQAARAAWPHFRDRR